MNSGTAKARNEITGRFMSSGFDKLLFLDTDMVWNIEDIFKLIKSDHDICAIDYRKKSEEVTYTGALTGRQRDGWAEAQWVGAGLLCITKGVFEKMIIKFPETRYTSDTGFIVYALFIHMVIDGQYCSEDTTFCKRWLECGGDISILIDAETAHVGNKNYKGNLKGYIECCNT